MIPQNLMSNFNAFMQSPNAFLSKAGIPGNFMNNPDAAIRWLMDNGKISQESYSKAREMARQMGLKCYLAL